MRPQYAGEKDYWRNCPGERAKASLGENLSVERGQKPKSQAQINHGRIARRKEGSDRTERQGVKHDCGLEIATQEQSP